MGNNMSIHTRTTVESSGGANTPQSDASLNMTSQGSHADVLEGLAQALSLGDQRSVPTPALPANHLDSTLEPLYQWLNMPNLSVPEQLQRLNLAKEIKKQLCAQPPSSNRFVSLRLEPKDGLSYDEITSLPKNLYVDSLILNGFSSLTSLPTDSRVKNLLVENSAISRLPWDVVKTLTSLEIKNCDRFCLQSMGTDLHYLSVVDCKSFSFLGDLTPHVLVLKNTHVVDSNVDKLVFFKNLPGAAHLVTLENVTYAKTEDRSSVVFLEDVKLNILQE